MRRRAWPNFRGDHPKLEPDAFLKAAWPPLKRSPSAVGIASPSRKALVEERL